jgi:hypothetical protein
MYKKRVTKLLFFIAFITICIGIYSIYSNRKENIEIEYGIGYGDSNAKIKMVEYMSFQCIDCYELHENIGDTLREKIKNGEVYYVVKHVDFDKFKYDDVIFNRIDNLDKIETVDYIMDNYKTWSEMKNVEDVEKFFKLGDVKKDRVEMQKNILAEKDDLKIDFIPTFYLNGKKYVGSFTEKEFNQMIDDVK